MGEATVLYSYRVQEYEAEMLKCSLRKAGENQHPFTITLHVIVEKQAVFQRGKAEAGVVALIRNVARGQTWVSH